MNSSDAEKAKADKAFRAQMILYLIMGIFIFAPWSSTGCGSGEIRVDLGARDFQDFPLISGQ